MERVGRKTAARLVAVALIAVALVAGPTAAGAAVIPNANFDTISGSIGSLYGSMTSTFTTPDLTGQGGPASISTGQLTSSVYQNGSVFTYVLDVAPTSITGTRLSTGFLPALYNNMAGYSFFDAVSAGAPAPGSTAFGIVINTVNLSWSSLTAALTAGLWNAANAGETVTFFYQSELGPGVSTYNLAGRDLVSGVTAVSGASGLAPVARVAEPASLLLVGLGAVGTALVARRRRAARHDRGA
jgi:hypothetical protein